VTATVTTLFSVRFGVRFLNTCPRFDISVAGGTFLCLTSSYATQGFAEGVRLEVHSDNREIGPSSLVGCRRRNGCIRL